LPFATAHAAMTRQRGTNPPPLSPRTCVEPLRAVSKLIGPYSLLAAATRSRGKDFSRPIARCSHRNGPHRWGMEYRQRRPVAAAQCQARTGGRSRGHRRPARRLLVSRPQALHGVAAHRLRCRHQDSAGADAARQRAHHARHLRASVARRRRVDAHRDRCCDRRAHEICCVPTAYRGAVLASAPQVSGINWPKRRSRAQTRTGSAGGCTAQARSRACS